jgi:hypothetical protein
VPECEYNADYWGSVFCDNTVQVRRIAFTTSPAHLGMQMNILPFDLDADGKI